MKAFCLFEQSGTFKNEFRKLGIEAEDYDIRNDYGQTDHVVDLFEQITRGGAGDTSLFDEIKPEDIVMAFFPCERFENQVQLWLAGNNIAEKCWSDAEKLVYAMNLHDEVCRNYKLIGTLIKICLAKNIKLIIENPYSADHYLTRYFPIKPSFVDYDRRVNGDYYKKPTQFWFINCSPKHNSLFEPIEEFEQRTIQNAHGKERSEIHPQYASRFIRAMIL